MVEAPGIEPGLGSRQPIDSIGQSQYGERGSNVDPAADGRGPARTWSSPTEAYRPRVDWRSRITIEPGKRGGRPCLRGLRITVSDVLECLANGMSEDGVLRDFPDLEREDIRAALAFAAAREERVRRRSTE